MRFSIFPPLVISLLAAGCALDAESAEGLVDEADQSQIMLSPLLSRVVVMTFNDRAHTPFAEVHTVTAPTATHVPGTEYWYVNRASLGLLSTHSLDIATQDRTIDPPDPDYPSMQTFTEVQFPTSGWGSAWTTDPLSYGTLRGNGSGKYLRIATNTAGNVSRVGWYQVIPMTQSPAWLTPSGHFSKLTGLSVPSGYRGYDIDQAAP